MRRATFGALAVAACLLAGCSLAALAQQQVKGSGTMKEETREVGDFTGVEVSHSLQATITIGPKAVKLSADDNLLPLIVTEVKDGRLVAKLKENVGIQTSNPMKLTISTPKLDSIGASGASHVEATVATSDRFAIDVSGASHATVKGLDTDAIEIDASGASQINVAGRCKSLKLDLSGASNLKANDLDAQSVQHDLSGASHGEVRASSSIEGDVSGASKLQVFGQPSIKKVGLSGAGSVSYR
jgi:hypothetical protein